MSDITQIIPRPTWITLGKRRFLASELRLGDLSDLQSYVKSRIVSPYDVAEPFLSSASAGVPWKRLLADTIEAQEDWPPSLGSNEANQILWDDGGRSFFAWVVIRREQKEITLASIASALELATFAEFSRLSRVAWAVDPMGIMAQIVDGPDKPPTNSRDWSMAWYEYVTKCRNGPAFDELTLTQLNAFMGEGSLPDAATTSVDIRAYDAEKTRRRDAFWAEIDNPEVGLWV